MMGAGQGVSGGTPLEVPPNDEPMLGWKSGGMRGQAPPSRGGGLGCRKQ